MRKKRLICFYILIVQSCNISIKGLSEKQFDYFTEFIEILRNDFGHPLDNFLKSEKCLLPRKRIINRLRFPLHIYFLSHPVHALR